MSRLDRALGEFPEWSNAADKPRLSLSVGVIGHRRQDDIAAVAAEVGGALVAVRDSLISLRDKVRPHHGDAPPMLELVTGLAAGTDQAIADLTLDLESPGLFHVSLGVVLPFPAVDYQRAVFADCQAAGALFEKLIARARSTVVLDGASSTMNASLAYAAVGRTIVANADLLIVVWNGRDGAGRGGTQAVLDLALARGVPTILVPCGDALARLGGRIRVLRSPADLARLASVADGAAQDILPAEAIASLIEERLLLPTLAEPELDVPPFMRQPVTGAIYGFARAWHFCVRTIERSGLTAFSKRAPITALEERWRLFGAWPELAGRFQRLFIDETAVQHTVEQRTLDALGPQSVTLPSSPGAHPALELAFGHADGISIRLASRERTAILLSIGLGVLAVCIAAVGVTFSEWLPKALKIFLLVVEMAVLILIAILVGYARLSSLTPRWLAHRFLAELLRTAPYLRSVGRPLPFKPEIGGAHSAGAIPVWTVWHATALVRSAGLPSIDLGDRETRLGVVRAIKEGLVRDQYVYNVKTALRMRQVSESLEILGEWLFLATILALVVKVALAYATAPAVFSQTLTFLTIIFPTLSAGFLAQRELGEYLVVERRSLYMASRLAKQHAALNVLEADAAIGRPLAMQDVADVLHDLAEDMAGDSANWVALFETKVPVAG